MVDEAPLVVPPLRGAHLILREERDVRVTVANVTDITVLAARTAENVARLTHVEPKRVVMRGVLIGTGAIAVAACAVLWMTHTWSLPTPVVLGALVVIGVPFGIIATKVLPKLLEQAAGGGH